MFRHHRASVNAKIKALKRPRLKIRECSRTRKCCPLAATFPDLLEELHTKSIIASEGGGIAGLVLLQKWRGGVFRGRKTTASMKKALSFV